MDYKETTRTTVRIMPDDRPDNQVPRRACEKPLHLLAVFHASDTECIGT